jgi:hypothetical protein
MESEWKVLDFWSTFLGQQRRLQQLSIWKHNRRVGTWTTEGEPHGRLRLFEHVWISITQQCAVQRSRILRLRGRNNSSAKSSPSIRCEKLSNKCDYKRNLK